MSRIKSMLSNVESAKLYNWMDGRRSEAVSKTAHELAEQATKDLGFTVSSGNIAGMRTGMGLSPRRASLGGKPIKECPCHDKIKVVAGSIAALIRGLGGTPSEELMDILK